MKESEHPKTNLKRWLKKFGWAGFAFFTIKGLVWIAIFFGASQLFTGC
jgi:hypothetical protein